jgi:cytochrome b
MSTNPETRVWDLPVRVFHWTLAGCFVGAYALSDSERWRNVHALLGYTVLGLIGFRLLWGFIGTRHARFGSFAYGPLAALRYLRDELSGRAQRFIGHNPAGSWAVYGMLLLGVATGVTGYLTLNEIGGEGFEEVHEACANAWLLLVVAHVLGVVFSSVLQRENLARAMVTGRKRGAPEGTEPRSLRGLGLALAAAVVGFWGWNLTTAPSMPGTPGAPGVEDHDDEEHSTLAGESESDDD